MNRKLVLGVILILIFIGSISICLAKSEDKGVTYQVIDRTYYLIKREFVERIDSAKFLNGAFAGIRDFLETKRISVDSLPEIKPTGDEDKDVSQFRNSLEKLVNKYTSKEIKKEELLEAALYGMLNTLDDPYTIYLSPKEYARLNESMSGGNFYGVGIYIELDTKNNNRLTVVEPIEGTPAYKAGILAGDIIVKIDGQSTLGITIDEAVNKIRGPEGTTVVLTVQRKNQKGTLDFKIKRAFIHVNSVAYKLIDKNIGYLRLRLFGEETNKEIDNAMKELEEKGAKAFILDLRNNGGGYVNAAVDVCSKFLPELKPIVAIKDRYGNKNKYEAYGTSHPELPLVVLVNQFSASASEITAGAIQDDERGILIGAKTFGKGSVQTIYPLSNGGALKITTAHYFTPRGRNINKKGLKPDIVIKMDEAMVGKDNDIQLKKAVEYLKKELSKHS